MTKFPWNYYCYVGWWWFSCSAATVMAASVVWRRRRMVMSGTCFRGWVTDYASQLTDIKSNNPKAYYNFCRMCPDDYDELLHLSLRRIQTVERHLSWRANIHERSTTAKTRDKLYFKLLSTCRRFFRRVERNWSRRHLSPKQATTWTMFQWDFVSFLA